MENMALPTKKANGQSQRTKAVVILSVISLGVGLATIGLHIPTLVVDGVCCHWVNVSYGIWGGFFAIVPGVLGIFSGCIDNKPLNIVFLIFTSVSLAVVVTAGSLAFVGVFIAANDDNWYYANKKLAFRLNEIIMGLFALDMFVLSTLIILTSHSLCYGKKKTQETLPSHVESDQKGTDEILKQTRFVPVAVKRSHLEGDDGKQGHQD